MSLTPSSVRPALILLSLLDMILSAAISGSSRTYGARAPLKHTSVLQFHDILTILVSCFEYDHGFLNLTLTKVALLGPNCPIANGSLIPCIEWRSVSPNPRLETKAFHFTNGLCSVRYIIQVMQKMQTDQIKSLEVKKNLQDAFNEYVQNVHQDLVWTGQCQSWCTCFLFPR
jgi:hypothetical protein